MEKQQILVSVVDMTAHTNSVQQWDLFATHVANVTAMLEYVDRSLQKDLRGVRHKRHITISIERKNQRDRKRSETKNVKHVTYIRNRSPNTESSTSSDNDLVNHLKIHKTGDETTLSCWIYINGHKTLVEPGTGAESNITDEIQFQALKNKSPE